MVGNLREKKKSGLFKKTKWKKKWSWTKAKEKKDEKEKKIEVQFELYYVKLVELMIFEKKKLCSTSL